MTARRPVPREAIGPPVTPAQLALWAEQQVDTWGSNTGYLAVTLSGAVTGDQLAGAALAVLRRHEPLRSVLRFADGELRQFVLPVDDALALDTVDLPCAAGAEHRAAREWMAAGEGGRLWDLAAEAPVRFHVLVHAPDRRTLVISVHHAGFDGRSKFVVAQDFVEFLIRIRADQAVHPDPLPQPAVPEADPDTCAEAIAYWTEELRSVHEPMALPGSATGRRHQVICTELIELDQEPVRALRELARRRGTSTFAALLGALSLQLMAYGNDRAMLGIAADVSDEHTRHVAGVQINVVPLLVRAGVAGSGADLVAEAGAALDRLRRFRRVPFPLLLRALPDRSAQRLMSQLGLSFPRPPAGLRLDVPGLKVSWDFFTPNTSATFEKILQVRADWPRCRIRLDHRVESMAAAEAAEFTEHFTRAVRALAATGGGPLPRRLPVDTAAARHRTGGEPPPDRLPWTGHRRGGRAAREVTHPAELVRHNAEVRGDAVALDLRLDAGEATARVTFAELAAAVARHAEQPPRATPRDAGRELLDGLVGQLIRLVADPSADRAVPWALARLAAARAHDGPGDGAMACPPAAAPALLVEALAAWLRGASLTIGDLPGEADPPPGIGRVCGSLRLAQALAGRADRHRVRELVVPLPQLQVTAELRAWQADGRRLDAFYAPDGRIAGWARPAADPAFPPVLDPAPGCACTVRADGSARHALPPAVPGRLHVRFPDGARLRTGDRARITLGGQVEYLGDVEHRWLRHNGFIDVHLVERVLHAHPQVAAAAVVARRTSGGLSAPVAMVAGRVTGRVAGPDGADGADGVDRRETPDPRAVRAHLRDRLDGYDLPSRVGALSALPRDPAGAIDRAALREPGRPPAGR